MMSGTFLNTTALRVANFYQSSESFLASSLKKIATGKRLLNPKDNIPDYFRSQKIRQDSEGFRGIAEELHKGIAVLQVAEAAGSEMFEDLYRMRELVDMYWDPDASAAEKSFIKAEFGTLAEHVGYTIENAIFDGKHLIQDTSATSPLISISIDPNDVTSTFDIDFTANHVPVTGALDITAPDEATVASDVQTELDKAGRYLGKVTGYLESLEVHYSLIQNQRINYQSFESSISDTDTAQEMSNVIGWQIRQQSSMAMLSQLNMSRMGVLRLFE